MWQTFDFIASKKQKKESKQDYVSDLTVDNSVWQFSLCLKSPETRRCVTLSPLLTNKYKILWKHLAQFLLI